ncbi:MAG: hydantoinase B/oxoprolinase family protein [Shinella sp.]|uniref:hydantoinase B/oxoprolinase family protein n=1 Tax=Shinella sp. TaxID=1870904 RepID=UPI003C718BC1
MSEKIDQFLLEILWTRLISIVDEAAATFVRTAFSSLAREANDFAVVITDARGQAVAQSSVSIPSFTGTVPATIKYFLKRFPAETLAEGDILITNDPWMGTGHVHDVTIAAPVFWKGQLVAFAGITSHMPDIGGRLRSSGIREIYEEGLQIPMLKLVDRGKTNDVIVDFIRTNVRVPDATMGDIWGEVSACHRVTERLHDLLDETQVDFMALSQDIRDRSEAAMREAIAGVPDGKYAYDIEHDGFEDKILIRCGITVNAGAMKIDFTGTTPQLPRSVNVVPNYTSAYTIYGVKALLCPDIPNNEGSSAPVDIFAPEGCILNPRYPAPGGARGMIGHLLPVAVMGALAEATPNRVWAPGSGNSALTIAGEHRGQRYASVYFWNAGQGASASRDGLSLISFPSNLSNSPIELMESSVPVRIRHRRIRRGSGGAGMHRGGDGLDLAFQFIGDSPAVVSFIMTRQRIGPPGIRGGQSGQPGEVSINGQKRDLTEHVIVNPGDEVTIKTAGGGGYGNPADRREAIGI